MSLVVDGRDDSHVYVDELADPRGIGPLSGADAERQPIDQPRRGGDTPPATSRSALIMRAFSMAMTLWSAKVRARAVAVSLKGRTRWR